MIETLSHPAQSAEFLSKLHDGELSPAEAAAFESHRRECPECRASVAEFEGALAAYRSAPVPPHASDLSARILRKIRAASPSRRPFGVMFGIDVRWAGALAAALLVVIIGAPVFRRAPQDKRAVPPATSLPAPIPAYVLDAEEERPKQKQNEANRAPRKEAAPKAEAAPPKSAADDPTARGRDLDQFAEPREGARESLERRDEIAATNADKGDAAATLQSNAAQEPPGADAPGRGSAGRDEGPREEHDGPQAERGRSGRRRGGSRRVRGRAPARRPADDSRHRRGGRGARCRAHSFGRSSGRSARTEVRPGRRRRRARRGRRGAAGRPEACRGQGPGGGRTEGRALAAVGRVDPAGDRFPAGRPLAPPRRLDRVARRGAFRRLREPRRRVPRLA